MKQIEDGIGSLPPGPATNALRALATQANGELEDFKKGLGNWFDEGMDRLNGIYTRWSRAFSLLFGLIVAVVFNVNSLTVGHALVYSTEDQQNAVFAAASNPEVKEGMKPEQAKAILQDLKLPVGREPRESFSDWADFFGWLVPLGWSSILGWLITGIAVSFGSHFWFDLLNKLMDLRTTGPKPDAAKSDA
jgi:hypothetical protein